MKAKLIPVYFDPGRDNEFDTQLAVLIDLFKDEAEFLPPVALGCPLPEGDAVVFPQLIKEAFSCGKELKALNIPAIVITSEFGTVAMWDWEIVTFIKSLGVTIFTPYNIDMTKMIIKTLSVKRDMQSAKFLVFQDDPGEGMQASIFKRFYWWEDQCVEGLKAKFGVTIVKKSFKQMGQEAKEISDEEALAHWDSAKWPAEGVSQKQILSAVKVYLAVRREVEKDPAIRGVGINCLNESFYSDSVPCLAWCMLFEEKGLIWACEADLMIMTLKFILHSALQKPLFMTNLYPFLMGMAALKHEKIQKFPDIEDADNCILFAHCGYAGLIPKCFSQRWVLRPKVLGIVDENAIALDAEMKPGPVTIVQMNSSLEKLLVVEGQLTGYSQYPGSDCRNGGVIRVADGKALMEKFYSHHAVIVEGFTKNEIKLAFKVFGIELE